MSSLPTRQLRNEMVEYQIARRGVKDEKVLEAMKRVPREKFISKKMQSLAYQDGPLPIGEEQTISQPYIVALMIEALSLKGGERVLEIGTGSGYSAAVLAEIAGEVFSIERLEGLANKAAFVLEDLGYKNVHVIQTDGTLGLPKHAPYDGIVVTAAGPYVPESLKAQLKVGGHLVIPVGADTYNQKLLKVTHLADGTFETLEITLVRFVPLVGKEGWQN